MKEIRDFVQDLWHEENLYNKPAPVDVYDAAYNLNEIIAEGRPVPRNITPGLFCRFWNRLCRTGGRFC